MKIIVFDTHHFEKSALVEANHSFKHELHFLEVRLTKDTAALASTFQCVCAFANDLLDETCLNILKDGGTKLIALRSAGFNNVDLKAACQLGITVVRVPEYSPYAVAEHAVGLMLSLNRRLYRAYNRVRELNFSLDGLVGFDMHGKTIGIIGTGRIGSALAHIMQGFGCKLLDHDQAPNEVLRKTCAISYVTLPELFKTSDIISLHIPLTSKSRHIVDAKALASMKEGVMIINTGRGALVDTKALISSLKTGHIGFAGLDVYEEEEGIFFEDHSQDMLQDDVLARLLTFPNVFITSHQGFLTQEALANIARTTLQNISDFEASRPLKNAIKFQPL
ncbi:MAG: 2-hydroxyacid dehydrogenase [Proteobacteria bacterium]|nr:2-hydroxyacid dehydrogenase [Pseudomonadota bacterium]